MSEAPERIWAWWDDEYDTGLINTHGDKRYTPEDAREYVRADRIAELEAKLAKAVEASADAIWAEYLCSVEDKWVFRKEHVQNAILHTLAALKGKDDD